MLQEIVNKITDALSGIVPSLDISVKLGIIGGAVILVLFFLALAISAGCKINKYRKLLLEGTKKLNSNPPITEANIGKVYEEIDKHPDRVKQGWGAFMDQRVGYPSDYIKASEVLSVRDFSGKGAAAKVFLGILGAIVWVLVGVIGFVSGVEVDSVMSAVIALEFIIIPVAVYIITLLLLDISFNRKIRRLEFAFTSFCEMLDDKVVINDREEKEFVSSEDLEEVNRKIQELIDGRAMDDDVIEAVVIPEVPAVEEVIDEEEPIQEEPIILPEDEPVEEEKEHVTQLSEMTNEEKYNYFEALISLVEQALDDEHCTEEMYCEIAAAINEQAELTGAAEDPDDFAIFEACFEMLATKINA